MHLIVSCDAIIHPFIVSLPNRILRIYFSPELCDKYFRERMLLDIIRENSWFSIVMLLHLEDK